MNAIGITRADTQISFFPQQTSMASTFEINCRDRAIVFMLRNKLVGHFAK